MTKLEDIIRKRRLVWLGHMHRMDNDRSAKHALRWKPGDGARKRGRPRMSWQTTVEKDLKLMEMTWEEAEKAAEDRLVWRNCVSRCAGGTGRTKVRSKE